MIGSRARSGGYVAAAITAVLSFAMPANSQMTLTSDGQALFNLTQFADGFPPFPELGRSV